MNLSKKTIMALCDEINISSSLKFLSSEFELLGYSEISYENDNDRFALVQLITVTTALISEFNQLKVKENERTIEILKFKSQINYHCREKTRFEKFLNKERNATLIAKESLASVVTLKKQLEKELRQSKMEINNLKEKCKMLNIQHGKANLSKENSIAILKAKLAAFINKEDIDMEETCALPQFSDIAKNQYKLEKYLCSLNNNIQFLILENANIRNLVLKIFIELSNKSDGKNNTDIGEVTQCLLHLPGEDFIDRLKEKLQQILEQIKFSS